MFLSIDRNIDRKIDIGIDLGSGIDTYAKPTCACVYATVSICRYVHFTAVRSIVSCQSTYPNLNSSTRSDCRNKKELVGKAPLALILQT